MTPAVHAPVAMWRGGRTAPGERALPEESAVAITYQRETHAVMMATPDNLADFATGFSLTEGVVTRAADILGIDVIETPEGIELRMDLAPDRIDAMRARRRRLAGPTGCGLCGIDSLAEAVRTPPKVSGGLSVTPAKVLAAMAAMEPAQSLGRTTRATHAAALWHPARGVLLREDVGRHNALDKLVGAAARAAWPAAESLLLLTSRVSIEMVQKACVLGASILVAVSAPTAHAVRLAEAAGLTLVGVARGDGFEVFTGHHRIAEGLADAA